jgi:hypothetical protein
VVAFIRKGHNGRSIARVASDMIGSLIVAQDARVVEPEEPIRIGRGPAARRVQYTELRMILLRGPRDPHRPAARARIEHVEEAEGEGHEHTAVLRGLQFPTALAVHGIEPTGARFVGEGTVTRHAQPDQAVAVAVRALTELCGRLLVAITRQHQCPGPLNGVEPVDPGIDTDPQMTLPIHGAVRAPHLTELRSEP